MTLESDFSLSEEKLSLNDSSVRPGRLLSDAKIVLQTTQAQQLFKGNWREKAIGLLEFSNLVHRIWQAAEKDDPYADLFLLRIYDALFQARKQIQQKLQYCQQAFAKEQGVELNPVFSEKPLKLPLQFATAYGYMAAYLLADLDQLIRYLITARRTGIELDKKINILLYENIRVVKKAFYIPLSWKYTDVTRQDIEANNPKAERAIKEMGVLNSQVLEGNLRAPYSPKINVKDIKQ